MNVLQALFGKVKSLNGNTFKYTTLVTLILLLFSALNNYVIEGPGPNVNIKLRGNNNDIVVHEPRLDCPPLWAVSSGTDREGDGKVITVCSSPDKRYVLSFRENDPPTALDTHRGEWVDAYQFYPR